MEGRAWSMDVARPARDSSKGDCHTNTVDSDTYCSHPWPVFCFQSLVRSAPLFGSHTTYRTGPISYRHMPHVLFRALQVTCSENVAHRFGESRRRLVDKGSLDGIHGAKADASSIEASNGRTHASVQRCDSPISLMTRDMLAQPRIESPIDFGKLESCWPLTLG